MNKCDDRALSIHANRRQQYNITGRLSSRRFGRRQETLVRDVSWHPNAQVLAATAWVGAGGWEGEGAVTLFGATGKSMLSNIPDSEDEWIQE